MSESWISRSFLALEGAVGVSFHGDPAHHTVSLGWGDVAALKKVSSETWQAIRGRVGRSAIVSTRQQGLFPVGLSPEAFSELDLAVAFANPRGRLRLLNTIKAVRPDTWVTTPCAALDFLARLYMEFNVDPFELGLEHIVLTGEICPFHNRMRLIFDEMDDA